MPDYPTSGVKLEVLTKEAASAVSDLMSQLDDLQGATYTASVTVEADASEAQSVLDDLPLSDETVNYTVDAEITGDNVDDLPQDGEKADYEVDTTIKEGNTDTADTLKVLKSINAKETFEMIVNIAGTALDFLKAFEQFSVEPLLDIDDAVAKIKAQTGETIPNIREIVSGIRYSDLGDSFDQITDIIIKAKQMGVPFEEATRAALTFTHAFTDQDPKAVLDTLNAMVTNKLAPNFKEASDLLTTAFQKGGNRAGDLLSTITKNATAFRDLNIDGKTALGNIVDGLNKGFSSADQVANVFNKIKQNVQNAAGNETSPVNEQLKKLGIPNPAESGKEWGVDFVAAVIKGIQEAPVSDAEKEKMLGDILGDKFSGKSFSALMQMSPTEAANIFANVKGAADTAAKDADDSLKGAFADFTLGVQQKVQEVLTDKSIDIPGKITKLKEGLQNALDTLAKGGSLSEALTVALKPIGFDDEFQGLESALGNFVIGILQAVAAVQEATGHGTEAAGTRATISGMGAQQLPFDLKVNNPDDVANTIQTAISRGVKPEDIVSGVKTAVDELIASGSKERAQAILDQLKTQGSVGLQLSGFGANAQAEVKKQIEGAGLGTLNPDGTVSLTIKPGMSQADQAKMAQDLATSLENQFGATVIPINQVTVPKETLDNLQKQIDDATAAQVKENVLNTKDADLSPPLIATKDALDKTKEAATNAYDPLTSIGTGADKLGNKARIASPHVDDMVVSIDDTGLSAMVATVQMNGFGNSIDVVAGKLNSALGAADAVNQQAAQQGAAANPDQTSGPHAAGGQFAGTSLVGEKGAEIVSSNRGVAVLNNMTTENILAALQNFIPGAINTGKSGNTYIANNNNIVNSQAEADSVGYSTARVLRGMG